MQLSELCNKYVPIYPDTHNWEDTVAYMLADPIEAHTVQELIKVLESGGKMRKPVMLGEATINDKEGVPTVTDGTHRVVAHILSGVEDVFTEDYVEVDESDEVQLVEGRNYDLFLETTVTFSESLSEEELDVGFSLLRSVQISDDLWLTSGLGASRNMLFDITWDIYSDEQEFSSDFCESVSTAIESHLRKFGFENKTFTVVTKASLWED